jgi:uncharacterized iron-regulated membrane protein
MDTIAAPETTGSDAQKAGGLYRMLWRWHFYAGIVCIPFIITLALTGSIYLFKPQIDAFTTRSMTGLEMTGERASSEAIAAAATASMPGSVLSSYTLPQSDNDAVAVVITSGVTKYDLWVHPETLEVMKSTPSAGRFLEIVKTIHGELLLGKFGSFFVEFAASWAIVMVLSGLYLWWPRNARGLAGVLYPRLNQGRGRMWRDLHAVTGVWVSFFALFLVISGLPWALVWSAALEEVRSVGIHGAPSQDWTQSRADEHAEHMATLEPVPAAGPMAGMDHSAHAGMDHSAHMAAPAGVSLDVIEANVRALNLAPPVLIVPPNGRSANWSVRAENGNRMLRVNAALDPATGDVLSTSDFKEKPLIEKMIGVGISAHEGQLFGWVNQLLGLLTATGLVTLAVTAFIMWRRRAPEGVLGAPPPIPNERIGWGIAAIIGVCGVLLPVLGMALIAIALIEFAALRHLPGARRWLGLVPA